MALSPILLKVDEASIKCLDDFMARFIQKHNIPQKNRAHWLRFKIANIDDPEQCLTMALAERQILDTIRQFHPDADYEVVWILINLDKQRHAMAEAAANYLYRTRQ